MVAIIQHMIDISVICFSPVGQYTGLEPTITLSVWHPTRDYDPARPVEGTYLLGNLVSLKLASLVISFRNSTSDFFKLTLACPGGEAISRPVKRHSDRRYEEDMDRN